MFTQAIGTDAVGNAIVDQICQMARMLHVGLIVEGIETEAQARYMAERYPSSIGQGWWLGKPTSADRLPPVPVPA